MSRALHRSRVVGRRGTRRTNAGIALAGLVPAGADRTRHASVQGAGGNVCVANGAQAWLSAARQVKEKSPLARLITAQQAGAGVGAPAVARMAA